MLREFFVFREKNLHSEAYKMNLNTLFILYIT